MSRAQATADARAGAAAAGYPSLWPVLVALAEPESGFDPRAVGDNGCSKGYLQFNQCGGLGQGHADAELLDGVSNMRLGAAAIGGALAGGATLAEALQPWSTRPTALATLAQSGWPWAPDATVGPSTAARAPGALAALIAVVGLILLAEAV